MANVSDMKEKCEKEEKEIFNLKSQIDNQDLFVKVFIFIFELLPI